MGRESAAQLWFGGATGFRTLLLESAEIILRGDLQARIPRSDVLGFGVEQDDLIIDTAHGPLRASLSAKDAAA